MTRPFETNPLRDRLAGRLAAGQPLNIVLMHLFLEAPQVADAAAAIAALRRQAEDPRLDALDRLLADHAAAHALVRAAAADYDHGARHAPAQSIAATAEAFDRLAERQADAGVALYTLGDPALFAAATAEVVAALAARGLLGLERDVLDLGCGMGRFAQALAPKVRSVLGLDLSPAMIARARAGSLHANVTYAVTPGTGLDGLGERRFDLILAADVFPYLVQAGPALAERHVADAARALRPGGEMVILNYSYRDDPTADAAELAALADKAGLALVEAGPGGFRLWDAALFRLTVTATFVNHLAG